MKKTRFLASTGLIIGFTTLAAPALAQTGNAPPTQAVATDDQEPAAQGTGSDVIVTARKRDERLIDVPISIQAYSAAELKTSGVDDLQTLKDRSGFQLPQTLSTGPTGRYQGNIIIRGLNAASFGTGRDNSGSLFIDGIFISGGQQSVNTADVERVEVLKGPQNAYFGRGTFGGAINFITRNPSNDVGGEVNLRATARGNMDGDISLEGPLIKDVLTARITGVVHSKVAQYRAADGGKLGAEETQSITGTLYATPAPNLWFRLRGTYQRDEDSTGTTALISANTFAAGACTGRTFPGFNQRTGARGLTLARNYFCNGLPTLEQVGTGVITANTLLPGQFVTALRTNPNNLVLLSDVPALDHAGLLRDAYRASFQAGYTFDSGASLGFNAGYNAQDSESIFDIDRTNVNTFLNARAFSTRDLTIDGRFVSDPSKPIRLLLGASYFWQKYRESQVAYNFVTTATTQDQVYTNERANVPAVYGSFDFDVFDALTLTGEVRYQWDKTTTTTLGGITLERTFKSLLPRVTIKYKPSEDFNIYASYAKGVQPAGFSGAFVAATPAQQAYIRTIFPGASAFSLLPKLDDYEAGIKGKLFGGSVSFALAAYQLEWKNATTTSSIFNPDPCFATVPAQQLTAACPLSSGGAGVTYPNDARIRGVEFEASLRATPELSFDITADYKDPKWRKYTNTSFNVFVGLNPALGDVYRGDGNSIGRVPSLSGTFSSTYRAQIGNDWSGYVRGDVAYIGKAWDSDLNIFRTRDYARVNARIGVSRENFTLELFSTNLLNDKTWDYSALTVELSGNFSQRANLVQPAPIREFGVRTQFKF